MTSTQPQPTIDAASAHLPSRPIPRMEVPDGKALQKARKNFGKLLTKAFNKAGLKDNVQIGELVAGAYKNGWRDNIPYDPAVVTAWKSGMRIPSEDELDAIKAILSDKVTASWEEDLDGAHEDASFDPFAAKHELTVQLVKWLSERTGKRYLRNQLYIDCEAESGGNIKLNTLSHSLSLHSPMTHDKLEVLGQVLRNKFGIAESDITALQKNYIALQKSAHRGDYQLDEEVITFNARYAQSGMTAAVFMEALLPHGVASPKDATKAIAAPNLNAWKLGQNKLPVAAVDAALGGNPPLTLLRAFDQRIKGERLWDEAVKENDFGVLLVAARTAIGETNTSISRKLNTNGSNLSEWENNIVLPGSKTFQGKWPHEAYGNVMQEADTVAPEKIRQNFGPFWTPERAKQMEHAFRHAIIEARRVNPEAKKQVGSGWEL